MQDATLGIVVPAYQPDMGLLCEFVDDLRRHLDPEELIVEFDRPDRSEIVRLRRRGVTVNAVDDRRGKGRAIADGFDDLTTDVLAFADADGSVPATSVGDVFDHVATGNADVSIASRRHPDAEILKHQTVVRRVMGDVFAWCAKRILPTQCNDYQCGCKAVRAESWAEIAPHCSESGFAWDLEFVSVAGAMGLSIAEVPVKWDDKAGSTVHPIVTPIRMFKTLLSVRRRTGSIPISPSSNTSTATKTSNLVSPLEESP